MQRLASGVDERDVVPDRDPRSCGSEETFERDLRLRPELERALLRHAEIVARRLTKQGFYAHVVRIKIKYGDFTVVSRQRRLRQPVMDTDSLYEAACELLSQVPRLRKGVRLVGVTGAELCEGPAQPELFEDAQHERRERLQRLSVALGDRFGAAGVTRAALLDDPDRNESRCLAAVQLKPGLPVVRGRGEMFAVGFVGVVPVVDHDPALGRRHRWSARVRRCRC